MNNLARNIIIWLIFGAALIGLFNLFQSPSSGQPANQLAYSDFVAEVEAQQIDEVLIEGRNLRGESKNGRVITSVMPEGANIVALNENIIFGAGLDVFEKEPVNTNNPLLRNEKVLLSPHSATFTNECKSRMSIETTKNIIDFFENKLDKSMIVKL